MNNYGSGNTDLGFLKYHVSTWKQCHEDCIVTAVKVLSWGIY